MKIITWNVNGIRAVERKGELQNLVDREAPDLLLIQEIKGNAEQFSAYLTENDDYEQYYHSAEKKGYSGTGIWLKKIFAKTLKDVTFDVNVPRMPNADEGRVSQLSFKKGVTEYDVFSIYFPNGGKSEQAWDDKLVFYKRMLSYMNKRREMGRRVIVGGDMNVAHTETDLARAKENDGRIGFHPDERAWMDQVIADDWADAWRAKNPGITDVYSWWDMVTRSRERNVGWRIDYFFVEQKLVRRIKNVRYLHEQFGSDHCPLLLEV